jgi:hypothetical protein
MPYPGTITTLLAAARIAASHALNTKAARRYLLPHLEASFGRSVEVGAVGFSLLDGARLEAYSVTVSEEPGFGNEYFLRADRMAAGLRWSSLFAGRVEFGSLDLQRPSLNLVRDAEGRWNIERWLPPAPGGVAPNGSAALPPGPQKMSTMRLGRIVVDGGRINFKQGDNKTGLAVADVKGQIEQTGPGRWQLDLEARPMRAGVELQDIGTLRVRGNIAGTSARLQPAELVLTWRNVSLADALRLSRRSDYGVRGALDFDLNARVAPPDSVLQSAEGAGGARWTISSVARLRGIHGWMLPARASDPSLNVAASATWRAGDRRAEVGNIVVEMPGSHLEGSAFVDWRRGLEPEIHFSSSSVGLGDIFAWYRAFQPGVPEGLNLEGALGVDATLGGWPLRLEQGVMASVGGRLSGSPIAAALKIGAINASVSRGGLDFAPTEISFTPPVASSPAAALPAGDSSDSFTIRGALFPGGSSIFLGRHNWTLSLEGGTARIQDWLGVSLALARPLTSGWTAAGAMTTKLRGTRRADSEAAIWLGAMDFRGVTASASFLNGPLRLPRLHVELAPAQRTITVSAAEAFGAVWRGTVARKEPARQWTFDLSADRLNVADLDRWLGPRARPGLLARLAGRGTPPAETAGRDATLARISASGRLRVAELVVAPLHFEQVDGQAELAGRTLALRNATAGFFGGKAAGKFDAQLAADPAYHFQGRAEHVDLSRIAHAVPPLDNRIAGTASSFLVISAHGIGHDNLVHSLEAEGTLDVLDPEFRELDLAGLIPATTASADSPLRHFTSAKGNFLVGGGAINVPRLELQSPGWRFLAQGRVAFSRALNFKIYPVLHPPGSALASTSPESFSLAGTLEAPRLVAEDPAVESPIRKVASVVSLPKDAAHQ